MKKQVVSVDIAFKFAEARPAAPEGDDFPVIEEIPVEAVRRAEELSDRAIWIIGIAVSSGCCWAFIRALNMFFAQ